MWILIVVYIEICLFWVKSTTISLRISCSVGWAGRKGPSPTSYVRLCPLTEKSVSSSHRGAIWAGRDLISSHWQIILSYLQYIKKIISKLKCFLSSLYPKSPNDLGQLTFTNQLSGRKEDIWIWQSNQNITLLLKDTFIVCG